MLLILAQARTGSSTLFRACMMHPDTKGVFEPFRRSVERRLISDPGGMLRKKFRNNIFRKPERFVKALDELKPYNCVKTVDIQLRPDLNKAWTQQSDVKTVILTRNNLLKQTVSIVMTEQSKVWHWFESKGLQIKDSYSKEDANKGIIEYYQQREQGLPGERGTPVHENYAFEEIPVKRVQEWMSELKHRKEVLKDIPGLHLTYEDLYERATTLDDRVNVILRILEYGGFDTSKFETTEPLRMLFEISKFNSEKTYRKVPNIEEIEQELGCPETGYLFK